MHSTSSLSTLFKQTPVEDFSIDLLNIIISYITCNPVLIDLFCKNWSKLLADLENATRQKITTIGQATERDYVANWEKFVLPYYPKDIHQRMTLIPPALVPHSFAIVNFSETLEHNPYSLRTPSGLRLEDYLKMITVTVNYKASSIACDIIRHGDTVWDPDFRKTFLDFPWHDNAVTLSFSATFSRDINHSDGGNLKLCVYTYSLPERTDILLEANCNKLTLAALNGDFSTLVQCVRERTPEELKTAHDFFHKAHVNYDPYSFPDIANRSYRALGQLVIAAEKEHKAFTKLTRHDKNSIRSKLASDINKAKSLPALQKLYDEYKAAQFFDTRRFPRFDTVRQWFHKGELYTTSKCVFIENLQRRALQILSSADNVAQAQQLGGENLAFLDTLFNAELIKRGINKKWIDEYEALAKFVVKRIDAERPDTKIYTSFDTTISPTQAETCCTEDVRIHNIPIMAGAY